MTAPPAGRPNEAPPPNPFVGPRSFAPGETLFGRDREAEEIVDLLIAERIVLLYSPSGAGKTSLINAKLVPMLRQEGLAVRPVIRVSQAPTDAEVAAGFENRYLFSTIRSLQASIDPDAPTVSPHVTAASTLNDFLTLTAPKQARGEGELLIFDQFEEILNVDRNAIAAKEEFFEQLGVALRQNTRWALISMREDFVAALDPYLPRIPRRLATRFRLDLLGVEAACRAIRGPAEADGVRVDSEVIARLVDDLRRVRVQGADGSIVEQLGPVVEPVQLQVVCYRSWGDLIRAGANAEPGTDVELGPSPVSPVGSALGGVNEALAGYYDDKVATVAASVGVPERAIREWCEGQLITAHGFRGQVLREFPATQGLANEAVAGLIDAHLVRSDEHHGGTWYELAHDRLIEPIRTSNAAWRDRHLDQFQVLAADWAKAGSPASFLPAGKVLRATLASGRSRPPGSLSPAEANYLDALGSKADIERSRRDRRIFLASFLGLLAATAGGLFVINKLAALEVAQNDAANARTLVIAEQGHRRDAEEAQVNQERFRSQAYGDLMARTDQAPTPIGDLDFWPQRDTTWARLIYKYADGDEAQWPPIYLSFNGERVARQADPKLNVFNSVDIYAKLARGQVRRIWSDRVADFRLRATYDQDGAKGAALGTTVVTTPMFSPDHGVGHQTPDGQVIGPEDVAPAYPTILSVDVKPIGEDSIQSTTRAAFGPYADLTSVRTFKRPVVGPTETKASIDLIFKKDVKLDTRLAYSSDKISLFSMHSMYCDERNYNTDLVRVEGHDGRIHTRDLKEQDPNAYLGLNSEHESVPDLPLGTWFELVKRPGSAWYPDSPTIRVEVRSVRGFPADRLAIAGAMNSKRSDIYHGKPIFYNSPGEDNLRLRIGWLDVPHVIPAGTALGLDFVVIARPPDPADRPAAGSSTRAPR